MVVKLVSPVVYDGVASTTVTLVTRPTGRRRRPVGRVTYRASGSFPRAEARGYNRLRRTRVVNDPRTHGSF